MNRFEYIRPATIAEAVAAVKGASPRHRLGRPPLELRIEEVEHAAHVPLGKGVVEAMNHTDVA